MTIYPIYIKNWYICGKILAAKRLKMPWTLLTKFYGTTDVTRDGNSLYDKSLIDKGIITIRDISNEIRELLSWSEAEQKFSLNRAQILNWLGFLNCIPKAWKNKLAANSERLYSAPANLNTKQMPFITSKTAYQILLKSLVRPATAQSSLESSLHLTNADWKKSICF